MKLSDSAPDRQAEVQAGPAGRQDPDTTKACPSALCQEDALLLGVVAPGGTVAYIQPPTRVGAEFVGRAQALGHPERRFRFSSACLEGACPQWTGSACAVIDLVIGSRPDESPAGKAAPIGGGLARLRHPSFLPLVRTARGRRLCGLPRDSGRYGRHSHVSVNTHDVWRQHGPVSVADS